MTDHQANLICGIAPFRALGVCEGIYPDSIPAESAIDSFYYSNQSTSIGLFTSLHSKSDSLFSLSVGQKDLFYTSDSLIVLYLKQIVHNDSLLLESPSVADSIELLNENSKLKEMLNGIIVGNNALLHELDSLQGYYADSLYAENSAISTSETIEDNIRDINAIYYSTLAKGVFEFDSSQQATLYAIGTQCPNSGGKAVLIAQGMYHLVNDTIVFNSDTLCQGYSPRIALQVGKLTKAYIYPNPAQDMATLWVQVPDQAKGACTLIDPVGREIMKFPVTCKV